MNKKEIINKIYKDQQNQFIKIKLNSKIFIKKIKKKEQTTDILNTAPSIRPNTVMGNAIRQNCEIKKNIPSDIG